MKIDCWSDVACPFCYIGERNLKKALKKMNLFDSVEFNMMAFQLNPQAPSHGQEKTGGIAERMGEDRVKAVCNMAEAVGIEMNLDKVVSVNTFDAHRLIKFAEHQGGAKLADKVAERLFKAYFTDGLSVGDPEVLKTIGTECGLDEKETEEVIDSEMYSETVRTELQKAHQNGIGSVPFFVFNDKYALSGAQPPEVMVQAVQQVMEQEKGEFVRIDDDSNGGTCGFDGC